MDLKLSSEEQVFQQEIRTWFEDVMPEGHPFRGGDRQAHRAARRGANGLRGGRYRTTAHGRATRAAQRERREPRRAERLDESRSAVA